MNRICSEIEKGNTKAEEECHQKENRYDNQSYCSFEKIFTNFEVINLNVRKDDEEIEFLARQVLTELAFGFMTADWGEDRFDLKKSIPAVFLPNEIKNSFLPPVPARIMFYYKRAQEAKKTWHRSLLATERVLKQMSAYFPVEKDFSSSQETLNNLNIAFDLIQREFHKRLIGADVIEKRWSLLDAFIKNLVSLEVAKNDQELKVLVIKKIDMIKTETSAEVVEKRASLNCLSLVLDKLANQITLGTRNNNVLYNEIMKMRLALSEDMVDIKKIEVRNNRIIFKNENDDELGPSDIRYRGEKSKKSTVWLRRFEIKYQSKLSVDDLAFLKIYKPEKMTSLFSVKID